MKAITPFIIIAICIGMYLIYIGPTFSEIKTLSAKKSDYTNVLQKSKELKDKRDSALTAYNSISETDIDRLAKVIPNIFDPVLLANDINSMANKYGMTIKGFKVNESKAEVRSEIITQSKEEPYKTISVTFTTNGGYEQFVKFLKDIEFSLRLIDVESLSIKVPGNTGQKSAPNFLDYSLEVHTYSLR